MAIGTSVGTAFLDVSPQLGTGFQAQIGSKLTAALGPIGAVAGAGLAVALGAGFAAFKIGETFDEAFDQIRIQTGATGDELAGLQEDFKAVFAAVPTDAATASAAIAGLAQRLNLAGQPLQDLSAQFLELSRITGTDLEGNIESVTRAFGDWGIAVADQGATLDQLFRASQETGIGVDALGDSLVQFGAPLRQLGFDFETSAALIAQFEEEGVNAELVLGSLRIALGRMAKAGEEPVETLGRVVEAIQNAGDAGEANTLALELFGAKAGPDMAAAIREGRFEIDELYATISGGSDTIKSATADTDDWRESLTILKNSALVGLEPVATAFFEGVGTAIKTVTPLVEGFFAALKDPEVSPALSELGESVRSIGESFRTIFESLKVFWAEWGDEIIALLTNAFETIGGIIAGVLEIFAGLIEFVVGVFTGDWEKAWEGIKTIFGGIWDTIEAIVLGGVEQIMIFFGDFVDDAKETIGNGIEDVVTFFEELPGKIMGFLEDLPGDMIEFGKDLVGGILEGLGNLGSQVYESIKGAIGGAIESAKNFFGISSPSTVFRDQLGKPFGQGVVVGFEEGLQPRQMLAAANAALAAVSDAALPSFGSSGFGTGNGTDGNLALATAPTMVTLYLDPEGKEKLAEFVVDWANRHIRQVSRAGG